SAGPRRTLLPAARSLLPWLITAAALVAAALGWLRQPPVTPNQPSVRFSHESDSLHQIASLCCGPPVAVSPDGRFIAYEGGMSDGQYLFIRASDQLRGRRLDGTTRARNLFFSDDGEWVGFTVGNALRKVPVGGGAPVTVAELPARMMGATWTATNEIILSLPDSGGLFAVSADGGALRRLTTPDPTAGEAVHTLPHYVPGENVVLFSVVDSTGAAGSAKVAALWLRSGRLRTVSPGSHPQFASGHLVTVRDGGILLAQPLDVASGDTTGPAVRLADGIVARPFGMGEYAISRHGTLVHSARLNSAATLVMVSGDGVERRLRTSFTADQVAHFDNPRLSPDGRRLIVAGYHDREGRHIGYLVDVQRGSSLRLTFDADTEFLEWTPDGQSVVYVRDRTAIATRRVDRSGEERFITRLTGTRIAGRLTLGGGRMAFAVQGRSNTDIWSAALGASDSAHPYLATSFNESAPALSPDGRWLAYVSDETGRSEVYVTAFHDAAGRTTVSVDGGLEPQWSRDGRSLYFRTPGGDVVIASLGIVGGNLETLSRRVLFRSTHERSGDGAEFDVTPRGDQFLMVGVSGVGGGLVITTNAIR
ncbi:MAG TPA: hypothetical protein VNL98_07005, partial [Gemmatimonadales bacterium]|nr:hypothetical protein [Gemmatimonadales bacterium]